MTEEEMKAAIAAAKAEAKEEAEAKTAELEKLQADLETARTKASAADRIAKKFKGVDLDKLKEAEEKLKEFDGVTPEELEQIRDQRSRIEDEEDRKLFSEGGMKAVIEKRFSEFKAEADKEREAAQKQLEEERQSRSAVTKALQVDRTNSSVADWYARNAKKVHPTTLSLVQRLVIEEHVTFDDDNNPRIKGSDDGIVFSAKDPAKPMTVSEYLDNKLNDILPGALVDTHVPSMKPGSPGRGDANPFLKPTAGNRVERLRLQKSDPEKADQMKHAAKQAAAS